VLVNVLNYKSTLTKKQRYRFQPTMKTSLTLLLCPFLTYSRDGQFNPVNVNVTQKWSETKKILKTIVSTSSPTSLLTIQSVFSGIELFTPP